MEELEPPAWFKKYVAGVKQEENLLSEKKKPKKQVKVESDEIASERW